jgi:hypothetical protein
LSDKYLPLEILLWVHVLAFFLFGSGYLEKADTKFLPWAHAGAAGLAHSFFRFSLLRA